MSVLTLPWLLINLLGGTVGGIWLLSLGYWQVVVADLLMSFSDTFVANLMMEY